MPFGGAALSGLYLSGSYGNPNYNGRYGDGYGGSCGRVFTNGLGESTKSLGSIVCTASKLIALSGDMSRRFGDLFRGQSYGGLRYRGGGFDILGDNGGYGGYGRQNHMDWSNSYL
ncbi:hypothetical protein LTR53_005023 [Teratosphaeriaceae sp. CCFEE 6253]|nr:hypothetical protein LTR53_005023 [Teratosphaeriaceae sp. CCFEE 6253]